MELAIATALANHIREHYDATVNVTRNYSGRFMQGKVTNGLITKLNPAQFRSTLIDIVDDLSNANEFTKTAGILAGSLTYYQFRFDHMGLGHIVY